jgi:hypothetical protein
LEDPIICARKVETTPVPDLNVYDDDDDAEKGGGEGVSASTGMELKHDLKMGLALFPDRAEDLESGWHRRLPRVRPGERTCLLFFKVLEPTSYTNGWVQCFLTCWFVDPLVVILGQM